MQRAQKDSQLTFADVLTPSYVHTHTPHNLITIFNEGNEGICLLLPSQAARIKMEMEIGGPLDNSITRRHQFTPLKALKCILFRKACL